MGRDDLSWLGLDRCCSALEGETKGIFATAHKQARILYARITQQKPYDPNQAAQLTPATQSKLHNNLQPRAAALGRQLIEVQTSS